MSEISSSNLDTVTRLFKRTALRIVQVVKWAAPIVVWLSKLAALFSFILVTWVVGFKLISETDIRSFLAKPAELTSILFGAASLALFVFSIVLAVLAIIGWQTLKDTIRDQVNNSMNALKNELRGRILTTMGYVIGEMNLRHFEGKIEVVDKERLSEIIALCQDGYRFLRPLGGAAEFLALNNLLFYSVFDYEKPRAGFLLDKAEDLLKAGQEHNVATLVLTACGIIMLYETDEKKRRQAREILEELERNPKLTFKKRNEAKYFLTLAPAQQGP